MQIDFHHGATYVIARLSGFGHAKAEIIAHAAQYVDDATNDGLISFDNLAMYKRIASAHKMLDYKNIERLANHQVWIPFHFLPGNEGKAAGLNPDADFRQKIVCKPNSYVAKDMVRACIEDANKPNALHRLGITMHVYADTWAHQGFAGINDRINLVLDVLDENNNPDPGLLDKVKDFFSDRFDDITSTFVGGMLPLGHGAALSYPDRPYLKWHYTNGEGTYIERDNPRDFLQAADEMCKAMRCFQLGDADASVAGLTQEDKVKLDTMFRNTVEEDGDKRHKVWLKAIENGEFGFPAEKLEYIAKGRGSWKYKSISDTRSKQLNNQVFAYHPSFLDSDWKHFHDALLAHRFAVISDILPRYGISAA
ncbi:DUF6765 family protein [uncultured Amphritea sp.]|uniref:DUF6765 family protein n=1 Tax=uncultured Amphritea sp. TaxID=981605 RepID=UPI0026143733|nr:DUF6765 family protein [uncultured Amphritea sp.]